MDSEEIEPEDEGGGGGLPTELIASYVAFVKRALVRRKWLALFVFVVVAGMGLGLLALWPRTYQCQSKLLAQRSSVLAARGESWNDGLLGASDVVTRRDNLEAIVRATDLIRLNFERRPFILRFKDSVMESLRGPVSEKDKLNSLVWTLETKLWAEARDQSLTIGVDWRDARLAAAIVEAAQQNFLESRHAAEISTYSEYISILEGHAATIRGEVETIVGQIRKIRDKQRQEAAERKAKGIEAAAATTPRRSATRPRTPSADPEVEKIRSLIDAKQRSITDLEEYRRRQLLDLQSKLAQLSTKYTSAHPAILDVQQNLQAASRESPQVTTLRAEVKELEAQLDRKTSLGAAGPGAAFAGGGMDAGGAPPLSAEVMTLMQEQDDSIDPAVTAQLNYAVDKYSGLRAQISAARIDLDTAQAAFKHRYKIVVPAEVPEQPIKPKVPLVAAAAIVLALILAFLVAIGVELRAGRIVEQWQVQQLALPVLGELRFPPPRPEE